MSNDPFDAVVATIKAAVGGHHSPGSYAMVTSDMCDSNILVDLLGTAEANKLVWQELNGDAFSPITSQRAFQNALARHGRQTSIAAEDVCANNQSDCDDNDDLVSLHVPTKEVVFLDLLVLAVQEQQKKNIKGSHESSIQQVMVEFEIVPLVEKHTNKDNPTKWTYESSGLTPLVRHHSAHF
jgi:hypothetical protein